MFLGRTRGAFSSQSVTAVVLTYYQTRVHIRGAHGCSYRRHGPRRALLFSRRPSGLPRWCVERVVYVRERVAQLRKVHWPGEVSRRASAQNSNREKEDTSYQFPSRADASRMHSCSLKHLLFMAFYVLTEVLPWGILYVGQYPAGKVLIYEI